MLARAAVRGPRARRHVSSTPARSLAHPHHQLHGPVEPRAARPAQMRRTRREAPAVRSLLDVPFGSHSVQPGPPPPCLAGLRLRGFVDVHVPPALCQPLQLGVSVRGRMDRHHRQHVRGLRPAHRGRAVGL